MVAAVAQCLVDQFDVQLDRGYTLPTPKSWLVRENKWRAARYGLDADIVVDRSGRTMPVRDALRDLVSELTPAAERLGCVEELHRVDDILTIGGSYQRQRQAAAANDGDLRAVVDSLMTEMSEGRPR
jgi:carboxylate-amine ligase